MKNVEIRQAMIDKGVKNYEVAEKLGISQYTFSHWLQTEMPPQKKQTVLKAIKSIKVRYIK